MSTIQDAILAATGGPTVNDGLASWYGKTDDESLQDAERRWLTATADETNQDAWIRVHGGGVGQINDVKLAFWAAQSDPVVISEQNMVAGQFPNPAKHGYRRGSVGTLFPDVNTIFTINELFRNDDTSKLVLRGFGTFESITVGVIEYLRVDANFDGDDTWKWDRILPVDVGVEYPILLV